MTLVTGSVPLTRLEREFLRRFIAARRWQFARTMPDNPHEYTVRKWRLGEHEDARFDRFVAIMYAKGWSGRFGSRWWPYLDIDGWSYWTFGSPLEFTTLINRKQSVDVPGDRSIHRAWRLTKADL